MFVKLAFAASLVAYAAAHATFQELWINGSNSPVTSVTSADIACNANPSSSQGICQVLPGDEVTVEMHQQSNDRSCANEAIGGQHYGPVIVYMGKVADAKTASGSSTGWFKVAELGLPSNNPDYWGTRAYYLASLDDNCGHFTFKVPQDIAPGDYLIRAEVIALHVASGAGGAQFYMSCYQVNVGGSGSASPATVSFPGAYSAQDPGILINIHQDLDTYVIPGPTPYGTTAPPVAATPYPTTATWNTALQPSTVPTAVPTAGAKGIGNA
ncbi:glycoside hydrolase family 61 protein [Fomes fomentarius]|nr:glycoside hydrolase family 61 protein [Fomes fomentarius]